MYCNLNCFLIVKHLCCFQSFDIISNSIMKTFEHMSFLLVCKGIYGINVPKVGFLSQRIHAFVTMKYIAK